MKRLQKSCNAILNNSNSHQRKSTGHQGQEKENAFPSSNSTNSSVDLSFDSTIYSLEDFAAPLPSSNLGVATKKAGSRIAKRNDLEQQVKVTKHVGFTGDNGPTEHNNVHAEYERSEEEDKKCSPTSVATANSLLPPLFDSDDEDEIVQFSSIDHDEEIIGVSVNIKTDLNDHQHEGESRGDGGGTALERKTKADDEIRYESKFVTNEKVVSNTDREVVANNCKSRVPGILAGGTPSRGTSSCSSSLSAGKSLSSDNSLENARSLVYESDEDNTGHGVAAGNSTMIPPKEVVAITSRPAPMPPLKKPKRIQNKQCDYPKRTTGSETEINDSSHDVGKNEDDEKKTAQELAMKLVRDLEEIREENERYVSKNRRLESKLQKIKVQQDENMIHRSRLVKACLYTSPVFILCGGLDAFLSTILLVWVLVEVDSYLDLSDEALDREDEEEDNSDDEDEDDSDSGDDLDDNSDNSSMSL